MNNEAWDRYIQPIISSAGNDHWGWIWDSFLKNYPNFSPEHRIQVEDALVSCSFDPSNEDLLKKALAITENLYRAKLASKRLSRKMKEGLRTQAQTINVGQTGLKHYIFAFSTFAIKEAIPNIKLLIKALREGSPDNPNYLNERSNRELFRACCISLLKLRDSQAKSFFAFFIVNDLRMKVDNPDRTMWVLTDLINFWDEIGVSGFKEIAQSLQTLQKEDLAAVLPHLKERIERIHYRSNREKQEVLRLVGELENQVSEIESKP